MSAAVVEREVAVHAAWSWHPDASAPLSAADHAIYRAEQSADDAAWWLAVAEAAASSYEDAS